MNPVREYYGKPLTYQRIAPANVATGIAAGVYQYKEYNINIDAGTDVMAAGDVIIGATSGAAGVVISVTVTSGAWGDDDVVGTIRFHSWNGTNFTDDEKIKVAADATCADVNGSVPTEVADDYPYRRKYARNVLVQAEANAQRVTFLFNLMTPDQTADYGILLSAGDSTSFADIDIIKNVRTIDAVASSVGYLNVIGYF